MHHLDTAYQFSTVSDNMSEDVYADVLVGKEKALRYVTFLFGSIDIANTLAATSSVPW
jgi:hypothetical protein